MIHTCNNCPNSYDETTSTAIETNTYCSAECELQAICIQVQLDMVPLLDQAATLIYRAARKLAGKEDVQ